MSVFHVETSVEAHLAGSVQVLFAYGGCPTKKRTAPTTVQMIDGFMKINSLFWYKSLTYLP